MTSRMMRISLVTAATIAALAATSCGSNGLNEGLGEDIDLISSTARPGTESGLGEVKELMELEIDHDFEIDDRMIELEEGQHSYPADTYRVKENAELREDFIGNGFDGENFFPMFKPYMDLHSDDATVLSSATWSFKGVNEDLGILAVRARGKMEVSENNGFYLAISNYETGRYELLGPFQNPSHWIDIRGLAVPNKDGEVHIAVILHNGSTFSIEEFEVSTEDVWTQQIS